MHQHAVTKNGKTVAWACGDCWHVWHGLEAATNAESCCKHLVTCRRCGQETDRYLLVCEPCRTLEQRERDVAKCEAARKVPIDEWTEPVWVDGFGPCDGFFSCVEELEEWLEDEDIGPPPIVWGTKAIPMRIDATRVIEQLCEHAYEGAYDDIPNEAHVELQAAVDAWTAKWGRISHEPDYTVALVLWPGVTP